MRKMFYCGNLIVFSCLQFADCYIWPRILSCGVILCLITVTESFWKVSLKKSWCCRKHVLIFEIVSLKGLNKLWSNHSFPIECRVKDLFAVMEKVWKLFHFGGWFFKLNFWVWEGDTWVKPLERSNSLAVKVKSID